MALMAAAVLVPAVILERLLAPQPSVRLVTDAHLAAIAPPMARCRSCRRPASTPAWAWSAWQTPAIFGSAVLACAALGLLAITSPPAAPLAKLVQAPVQ